jgi:DNA-binding MarR family transcriptional regulator
MNVQVMVEERVGGEGTTMRRMVATARDETRWLDREELAAWMGLAALSHLLPPALDAQLQRDAGISFFEYGILAHLSESPDRTRRMSQLAVLANGSLSRLSHAVSRLEDRGWIVRRQAADDGRVTEAHLTAAGYRALAAAAPGHVEEVRTRVLDLLTPAQVAQLRTITRTLVGGLDGDAAGWLDGQEPGRR